MEWVYFQGFLALIGIIYGIIKSTIYNVKKKKYTCIDGHISGYEEHVTRGESSYTLYRPCCTYVVNNITYTVPLIYSKFTRSGAEKIIGQVKKVYYDENNPSKAVVEGCNSGITFIIIGLLFLILPTLLTIYILTGKI